MWESRDIIINMDKLDLIQKIFLGVYFAQIAFIFFQSLWKRKKVTLGSFETTILPAIAVILLVSNLNFISAGKPILQIIGLVIFIAGSVLSAVAFTHLSFTNSDDFWIGRKEKKKRFLASSGHYSHIRHPIFTGIALGYLGLILAFLHPISIALWILYIAFGVYTSLSEEKFMAATFPAYNDYKKRTKRFF